jgi:hypothetical protein
VGRFLRREREEREAVFVRHQDKSLLLFLSSLGPQLSVSGTQGLGMKKKQGEQNENRSMAFHPYEYHSNLGSLVCCVQACV